MGVGPSCFLFPWLFEVLSTKEASVKDYYVDSVDGEFGSSTLYNPLAVRGVLSHCWVSLLAFSFAGKRWMVANGNHVHRGEIL